MHPSAKFKGRAQKHVKAGEYVRIALPKTYHSKDVNCKQSRHLCAFYLEAAHGHCCPLEATAS